MHKVVLFIALCCLLPACTTKYYLVRHAEKQDDSSNALLSAAGLARANILRDSLLGKGIDRVFASTFQRTQQTAQPLATALDLPFEPVQTRHHRRVDCQVEKISAAWTYW
jgi:broad specificity phosphatase PhoE